MNGGNEGADRELGFPPERVERWIADAREGSGEAIGQLLDACRQYLLLVANNELPPELHGKLGASDLVQETFLEAQHDFEPFQGNTKAQLLAWLRQILINNLRDAARRYQETGKRQLKLEVPLSHSFHRMQAIGPAPCESVPSPSWLAVLEENRSLIAGHTLSTPLDRFVRCNVSQGGKN